MRFPGAAPLTRRLVIAVVAAIVLSGCGGGGDEDVTATPESALSFREAGFGPGSLAVQTGAWVERVETIPGDWLPGLPVPTPIPGVCEVPDPLALQAISLAKFAEGSDATVEVVTVEARAYGSDAEAEAFVAVLNGETAAACDRTSVVLLDALALPGVRYDFGDGVGQPAEVIAEVPDGYVAESRAYTFEIQASLSREDLRQRRTSVAAGQTAITYTVLTLADRAEALEALVSTALFSEPAPAVIDALDLDQIGDEIRGAAFEDSAFPDDWALTTPLRFGGPGAPNICLTSAQLAGASGISWVSMRPGLGASQIEQRFQVYEDDNIATAALDELASLGASCLPAELGLSDQFDAQTASTETVQLGGRDVVVIDVGLEQLVSGQIFDIEARIAATQVDELLHVVQFVGLEGDAPDLVELVVASADSDAGADG